jgi:hypothetical protein
MSNEEGAVVDIHALGADQAIMGKTIGICRGLRGKSNVKIAFQTGQVIFKLSKGNHFSLTNELFNQLDTKEIVKIIEGHINGSDKRV